MSRQTAPSADRLKQETSSSTDHFRSGSRAQCASLGLQTGSVLAGRFTLVAGLGFGSHGDVYQAEDNMTSEPVALKVVDIGAQPQQDWGTNLGQELLANRSIRDHRHVIRVHDIHETEYGGTRLQFISMELATNGSLRDMLRSNGLGDDAERLVLFQQICLGVEAIHEADLFRLDIKPENVLLVNGVAKVCDIGGPRAGLAHVTRPYAAPELFHAARLDKATVRSDVFSLGVVLSEMFGLDHRASPAGGAAFAKKKRGTKTNSQPQGAAPSIEEIAAKCTRVKPNERYLTVESLRKDVEHWLPASDSAQTADETFLDGQWETARQAFTAERFCEAERLCRELLEHRPGFQAALDVLREVTSRHECASGLYSTIARDIAHRDMAELLELLHEAVGLYPGHPGAHAVQAEMLGRAKSFQRNMDAGVDALRNGDWRLATAHFQDAHEISPSAPGAKRALHFALEARDNTTLARGHIDRAIEGGDRTKALAYAEALDRYVESVRSRIAHDPFSDIPLNRGFANDD